MSEEKTIDIESMSAKDALGYFLPKVDEDARIAKKEGRLVCWSASVAPPEFCTAMDIAIVYPETHAAGIGARHGAPAMLEVAENKGYNQDICSYCRKNMGYMELLKQQIYIEFIKKLPFQYLHKILILFLLVDILDMI